MAKLHKYKKPAGPANVLVVNVDGERKRIWLGYNKLPIKVKNKLLTLADELESYRNHNEQPDKKLVHRVQEELPSDVVQKLSDAGLLDKDEVPTLKPFLVSYISTRTDLTEHTKYKLRNSSKLFVEFFGDVKLKQITAGDVEDYINHRKSLGRADASISAEIKHGKQFFSYAVKKQYLEQNPFADFKIGSQADRGRNQVLKADDLQQVIDAAPSLEWKALISFVRWTGCRVSEALLLKWSDINWDRETALISCSKTKRKTGKDYREVPLFQSVDVLREWFLESPDGAEYVISGLVRTSNRQGRQGKNLRKPFTAIIKKAGLEPWAKPWQNLRVTRENELEAVFPSHVVNAWIGNSRKVALQHYLQVTEEHFQAASQLPHSCQQGPEGGCNGVENKVTDIKKPVLRGSSEDYNTMQNGQAPPAGLEPATGWLTATCSTN